VQRKVEVPALSFAQSGGGTGAHERHLSEGLQLGRLRNAETIMRRPARRSRSPRSAVGSPVARRTDFAWKPVHTHALQLALKRVDLAFGHFFRRVKSAEKPGYPRFKSQDRFSGFRLQGARHGWRLEKKRCESPESSGSNCGARRALIRSILRPAQRSFSARANVHVGHLRAGALRSVTRTGEMISGLDWGVETFAYARHSDGTSEEIANPATAEATRSTRG